MVIVPKTPPQIFTFVSLLLISITMAATGLAQSAFFRQAVLQREAEIIRDFVQGLAAEHLIADDLDEPMTATAQTHLERSFITVRDLSGAVRVKVYDGSNRIIWSDERDLIGKVVPGEARVVRALAGISAAVFDPHERASHAGERLPDIPLIEFYVPFAVKRLGTSGGEVVAAFALYRNAEPLNHAIARGGTLLIAVSGAGGLLLYGALFSLYRSVYRRQREAETQFARLSTEHERIVQMEKLSAMGRMVAEIAHQLNNPLVGVVNLAQRAEQQADKPERIRVLLGEIVKAGEHCRSFVQRMLRFTKLAACEPQPTKVGGLVRDTIAFFAESVGTAPEVSFEAPKEEVVLQVDPVLMRHALFNLIHNAAQADPKGLVVVTVEPEENEGAPGFAIAVADHGPGLSAAVLEHIFTPFFSTRAGGTGLGLSVAQHIVVQHGGRLRAGNNPEGGARFVIWLPAQGKSG